MYAKIENNTVAQTMSALPKAYALSDGSKTGNFDLMNAQVHEAEGFLPIVENKPAYDPRIQTLNLDVETIEASQVTRDYIAVDIPISELKANRIEEIDELLNIKLSGSQFTFDGEAFNFHQQAADDAVQLQTLVGLGAQFPSPFSWTQTNGEEMPMDQLKFVNFANTLAAHKLGLIGAAKTHIATIKAFTTAQQVVEYDIQAGW